VAKAGQCPEQRDHLVLIDVFGTTELVAVNYTVSYRAAVGIDAQGWAQGGSVYIHTHSVPPSGLPDNSRLVAVLDAVGEAWVSARSNVSVTVLAMGPVSARVALVTTDVPHTVDGTSADTALAAWAIIVVSVGFAFAVAVACIVSADARPGYTRLDQAPGGGSRQGYTRLGQAPETTPQPIRMVSPGYGSVE
jgi:hypothetical protein